MTTKKSETATEETTAVALAAENTAVALSTLGALEADDFIDGAGFEGADRDSFAIPFIQILQKMSPKVDEDNAEYIPGAKAGMLYNTVTGQLYDGKEGFVVVPCAYKRSFIQWGGRESAEGGYKGEFTVEEFEAMQADETKVVVVDGRPYKPDADGKVNEKKSDYYADTRSHYVIVVDSKTGEFGSAILSLASSQIKASKKLLTSLQQKKVDVPGRGLRTPPTYANLVRVTTVGKSNEKGAWSGVEFSLIGLVQDKNVYEAARDFYKIVISGEAKADYSKADAASAQADVGESPNAAEEF